VTCCITYTATIYVTYIAIMSVDLVRQPLGKMWDDKPVKCDYKDKCSTSYSTRLTYKHYSAVKRVKY